MKTLFKEIDKRIIDLTPTNTKIQITMGPHANPADVLDQVHKVLDRTSKTGQREALRWVKDRISSLDEELSEEMLYIIGRMLDHIDPNVIEDIIMQSTMPMDTFLRIADR